MHLTTLLLLSIWEAAVLTQAQLLTGKPSACNHATLYVAVLVFAATVRQATDPVYGVA